MDKCGICLKPAVQLFETGKDGIYACFKCQPLVPEVMIGDNGSDQTVPQTSSNNEEEGIETSLYCGICHKSFQKNMQLQNHLRNHRAERRFVCTYCNKAFSQSNNLRAHLRIHTNERPFKCSECGKAFTQVTNLNNHVRLHTGERPFVCPEPGCNKAYAQVTNLNQHRKRHLNGGPVEATYDCTVCGEQFQQRNHMYMHSVGCRREAHGAAPGAARAGRAPRRCRACPAAFPSDKLLQRHAQLQHPGLQDDQHDTNEYICVFSSCGKRLSSAREHTEHLLREHQLRVLSHRQHAPRRGRPPKMLKDPLEIKEEEFHEVKITKQQPQYLPKLKVQSLFQ
ncbi:zinc finger protein 2 homolog isoform X2 [Trichoplusia ni]|uniref:Zinc finger protein 2 homolog isoform X2 n=1 Tax=Trichoplusia ni TaxID=7111 RepID=A0A7E5WKI9_TRINI|nr:zinc finger protein 2 homolog isoform X2 [Trichoplusia ni]